jgi:SulP family sulfate permease
MLVLTRMAQNYPLIGFSKQFSLPQSDFSFEEMHNQELPGGRLRLEEAAAGAGPAAQTPGGGGAMGRGPGWGSRLTGLVVSAFPILSSLRHYAVKDLSGDLASGFAVGVMLVPQSLGNATLAGVPPGSGLSTGLAAGFVYALIGGSRQASVGPVSVLSLMTGSILTSRGYAPGSEELHMLATLSALLAGLMLVAIGIFRLGFVLNVLAGPVISGFVSAAGMLTIVTQIKTMCGVKVKPATVPVETVFGELYRNALALKRTSAPAVVTAIVTMVALIALKKLKGRSKVAERVLTFLPANFLVVTLGTLTSYLLSKHAGIKQPRTGKIASSLASPSVDFSAFARTGDAIELATWATLIGFIEAASIMTHFARVNDYKLSENREIITLGLSNLASGLVGGFCATASFTRSAENARAGSRTTVSSLVSCSVLLFAILVLTPALAHIPSAMLGGLISLGGYNLIQWGEYRTLYRSSKIDCLLMVATTALVLVLGIDLGIACAVGLSVVVVFFRMARPHFAVLGRLPGTKAYLDIRRFPHAEVEPGITIFHFDGPLFFTNAKFFETTVTRTIGDLFPHMRVLVLDLAAVSFVDIDGIRSLMTVAEWIGGSGRSLLLANVHGPVRDSLLANQFVPEVLPTSNVAPSVEIAVSVARALRDARGELTETEIDVSLLATASLRHGARGGTLTAEPPLLLNWVGRAGGRRRRPSVTPVPSSSGEYLTSELSSESLTWAREDAGGGRGAREGGGEDGASSSGLSS